MAQYTPGNVPKSADIVALQRFLRDELERIRQSTDAAYVVARAIDASGLQMPAELKQQIKQIANNTVKGRSRWP